MFYQVKTVNGQKTKIPLSGPVPSGNPIGTIISTYKKIQPKNYLYCDGSFFDQNQYPALYLYLGSNQLPDYRECVQVGAEQNTTDTIATHDVYTLGQFKDDQLQKHTHTINGRYVGENYGLTSGGYYSTNPLINNYTQNTSNNSGRTGTPDVTHGKQKAVYVYIKAVDGVDISDEDSFLTVVDNYVDEKIESQTELLWTNPNLASAFQPTTLTSQIIGKDLSLYKAIEVYTKNMVNGNNNSYIKIYKDTNVAATAVAATICRRDIAFNDTGIVIGAGFYYTSYSGSSINDNNRVLPIKIYGIK